MPAVCFPLPLTYAYDRARTHGGQRDQRRMVIGSIALAIALGAATVRRRTA